MKNKMKRILAGIIALGAVLPQASFAFAEEEATKPTQPEAVMYLYNRDCEDLTAGASVGLGAYLSSTFSVMATEVATPENDSSNGKSIKVTSAAEAIQYYKIFTGDNTYHDGFIGEYPEDYNNEVMVSFDVYREAGMRTPIFALTNNEIQNMVLAASFIDKNGKFSVATSKVNKSMAQENAIEEDGYFVYDTALEENQWHNIAVVYNKDEEKATWFVNGNYVCEASFPTENETYKAKKGSRYTMRGFTMLNEGLATSAYVDNIKIAYIKPETTTEIQTVLYSGGDVRGSTVTGPASSGTTFKIEGIDSITKDYMVEFDLRADTITAKGACICLVNDNNNALATAFMANTEGSAVIRTKSTPAAQIGASADVIKGYTTKKQSELLTSNLIHIKDVFRANVFTNFKLYVDIDEKVVYYYANDIYLGKTAATDYSLMPSSLQFTYPTNGTASIGGKFWVANMKVGYMEAETVKVTGFDVVNAEGYSLDGAEVFVDDGVEAYVKATVKNDTQKDVNLMIVIAQYNGDKMINTDVIYPTVKSGEEYILDNNSEETCNVTVSADTTGIRAFVWDADDSLMPYCEWAEVLPLIV